MYSQVTANPPAAPVASLRPVRNQAMVVVTLLVVNGAAGVAATGLSLRDLRLAELQSRYPVAANAWGVDAFFRPAAVLLWIVTLLATALVFVVWLTTVRANAERLTPARHRRHRAWVVLGWWVPIVQFWFPKQIVDDIWITSQPGRYARGDDLHQVRRPVLVWLWWVLCVISAAGAVRQEIAHLLAASGRAGDLGLARHIVRIDAFLLAPSLTAAALACVIVVRITGFQETRATARRRERALAQWAGGPSPGGPGWAPHLAGVPIRPPRHHVSDSSAP